VTNQTLFMTLSLVWISKTEGRCIRPALVSRRN